MSKAEENDMSWLRMFADRYGPYAFGVFSLLIVWLLLVKPELDSRTIDFEKQQELVSQMQTVSRSMEKTAVLLERTAVLAERTALVSERYAEELIEIHRQDRDRRKNGND